MSGPAITVVIPAWNLDETLRESIASVQAQAEPAHILVVNNVSDTPLPIPPGVEELKLKTRVSIGEARNAGLATVKTPYVFFVDADDIMLPDTLSRLRQHIEAVPGRVLAASGLYDWNPITDNKKLAPLPRHYAVKVQRFQTLVRLINSVRYTCLVVGSALLRTDAAKAAGGFPHMNYGEDWAFSVSLAYQGNVYMDRVPVKLYRIDPREKTLVSSIDKLSPRFRACMKEVRRRLLHDSHTTIAIWLAFPLVYVLQNVFYVKKMIWKRRKV